MSVFFCYEDDMKRSSFTCFAQALLIILEYCLPSKKYSTTPKIHKSHNSEINGQILTKYLAKNECTSAKISSTY